MLIEYNQILNKHNIMSHVYIYFIIYKSIKLIFEIKKKNCMINLDFRQNKIFDEFPNPKQ